MFHAGVLVIYTLGMFVSMMGIKWGFEKDRTIFLAAAKQKRNAANQRDRKVNRENRKSTQVSNASNACNTSNTSITSPKSSTHSITSTQSECKKMGAPEASRWEP